LGWHASKNVQRIVLLELVRNAEPLRFKELWEKCKGSISKMSFSKALVELEDAKTVVRVRHGRKNVEYHLNPHHPEIRPLLDFEKKRRSQDREHYVHMEEISLRLQRLAEPPSQRKLRKPWTKSQAYSYAFMLAYSMVYNTFQETRLLATQAELPILRELIRDDIMRTRLTLQEGLIRVFKTDAPSTMQAMEEWLSEAHSHTVQASRAVMSSPKR